MNLVMDFCDGGDLSNLIKKSKEDAIPIDVVKNIINQLIDAIKFIHSKNIIHRDLKPQNIFIMKNSYTVKLGDLGLARELNKGNNADTLVGTFSYMAPEIVCFFHFSNKLFHKREKNNHIHILLIFGHLVL